MSIVRTGLAETKGFSEGWDAIFGKKKTAKGPKKSKSVAKKKPVKKKKTAKKK